MLILLWDVCSYDAVSCVLNISEELAAVLNEQGETAQVTQADRQAFVSIGWAEGANMRALLTLTLNMETDNSPKIGHRHIVQKKH